MANPMVNGWEAASDTALPGLKALGATQSLYQILLGMQNQIDSLADLFKGYAGFSWDPLTSTGLTAGFKGGVVDDGSGTPVVVTDFTVSLTASVANYIMLNADGTRTVNTSGFVSGKRPIAIITPGTSSFTISNVQDRRGSLVVPAVATVSKDLLDTAVQQRIPTVSITVGSESGNNIDVTIQLKDVNSTNLSDRRVVDIWLADTNNGSLTATAPSSGLSVQTGTLIQTVTANKHFKVMSNSSGQIVMRLSEASVATWYMAVLLGDKSTYSAAITFA